MHRLVQMTICKAMKGSQRIQCCERLIAALEHETTSSHRTSSRPKIPDHCRPIYPTHHHHRHTLPQMEQLSHYVHHPQPLIICVVHYTTQYGTFQDYDSTRDLGELAVAISEQANGIEHADTAESLYYLAWLHDNHGKYDDAEPLYQRALTIREKVLGPDHPDTAASLNNLALLYDNQGKYDKAEPLYQRALAIKEKVLGPDHPDTALSLNNLAELYDNQGKYDKAEPLYQRALTIQ